MTRKNHAGNLPLVGAVFAGLAASLCCIVPLVLVMAGLGGAWMSVFSVMEPWRPLFLGMTAIFVVWGWYRLYLHRPTCEPGSACASPGRLHRQRLLFWGVTAVVGILVAFPWYAHLLYI